MKCVVTREFMFLVTINHQSLCQTSSKQKSKGSKLVCGTQCLVTDNCQECVFPHHNDNKDAAAMFPRNDDSHADGVAEVNLQKGGLLFLS